MASITTNNNNNNTTMMVVFILVLLCRSNFRLVEVVTAFTPTSSSMKMTNPSRIHYSSTNDKDRATLIPLTMMKMNDGLIPFDCTTPAPQEIQKSIIHSAGTTTTSAVSIRSMIRNLYTFAVMTFVVAVVMTVPFVATAVDETTATATLGASSAANAKLTTGGASTLQSGRTISITRGVNLDNSNFANQNLKGVAFQQSVVRDSDFSNSNLYGASFFDATVDGSNFNNADMTMANIEMAQFNRASMKNTVARDMYVSGATLLEGIADIEGSDWTDTYLRADQKKYLCAHPTAKGINPTTGVSTRESLLCKD